MQGTRGPTARAPTAAQTSAYLAGSVTVSIIYVQSGAPSGNCNPPDPVTERWDDTRRSQVFNQISQGLNFWATRNNRPAAVTFVLDDLGVQLTSCEPINRPSTQEGLWIADVLTRLGVSATPSNYIDPARLLAHQRRTQRGTNWGYLIFVVDSLNNTSGTFTDGAFAYSYLQGPFIVMTYDNDGWGSDRLHFVAAHETGHIFGALDEYASSGCSPSDTGGYFGAPNTSCNNGGITTDVSIMGEPSEQTNPNVDVSDSARAAIGWRNPTPRGDGTAVVDVVRTSTASVQPYSPNPTTNPQPTFNATASNQPAGGTGCTVIGGVTRFCATPVNIARVASAEWQVDGGAWQTAGVAPADGAFDSETENYTFTPPAPVGNGTHTFATRATNNFGHTSAAATTSLTINATPSCAACQTTGVFRPNTYTVYLKLTNSTGVADIQFLYGQPGDQPLAGDWTNKGYKSIGVYRPSNSTFYLRNSNSTGVADLVVLYGMPGDQPVVGDWDGNGTDTVGIYRNGVFYLRNSNTPGFADLVIPYGNPGDIPLAGHWSGGAASTIGVYRPSNSTFYLRNSNTPGPADLVIPYGIPGDVPVVGDWDGDGRTTIGVYRNGTFYLRNSNTPGVADLVFGLGIPGDLPIAGRWAP
ncbi:MAG: hypothetical protein IRZ14_17605 [Chloroflexi bacterium]|nr:hypothetical protein [Chloroflexota bacterium]